MIKGSRPDLWGASPVRAALTRNRRLHSSFAEGCRRFFIAVHLTSLTSNISDRHGCGKLPQSSAFQSILYNLL